jgi:hypothetical protein
MTTPNQSVAPSAEEFPAWKQLVASTVRDRHDPRHAGKTSALRFAAVPATEISAFGFTEAYLGGMPQAKRVAVRRAVGICAKHLGAGQPDSFLPVGGSLRMLHKHEWGYDPGSFSTDGLRRNAMTMQVDSLPLLDQESAAQTLDLLVGRCASAQISVDFFAVTRLLMEWGNGMSPDSRESRARVVCDFYSYIAPLNNK